MGIEAFWGATPGEVMQVIFAAGETQRDLLEVGVLQVWLGRLVSQMKHPDLRSVLPPRRGERRPAAAGRDERYTASEAARWSRYFNEQEQQKAGNA
jgi:hypothetical protein